VGCAYPIRLSTTYFLDKHLDWSGIAFDAFDYYRKAWTNGEANEEGTRSYFAEHGYVLLEDYLPYDRANWYFTPRD